MWLRRRAWDDFLESAMQTGVIAAHPFRARIAFRLAHRRPRQVRDVRGECWRNNFRMFAVSSGDQPSYLTIDELPSAQSLVISVGVRAGGLVAGESTLAADGRMFTMEEHYCRRLRMNSSPLALLRS